MQHFRNQGWIYYERLHDILLSGGAHGTYTYHPAIVLVTRLTSTASISSSLSSFHTNSSMDKYEVDRHLSLA